MICAISAPCTWPALPRGQETITWDSQMDILDLVVNLFTNTDAFLVSLATDYGTLIYAAMFLIFFL